MIRSDASADNPVALATKAAAYMDVQDAHFRRHEDFDIFGKGWLNRLAALREFVATLPQGAGLRPTTIMKITESKPENAIEDVLGEVFSGVKGGGDTKAAWGALLGALLKEDSADNEAERRRKAILRALLGDKVVAAPAPEPIVMTVDGKPPLTPVNAALGTGIGHALDGKKSIIGVVGLLLTVLLPEVGLTGTVIDFINQNSANLITVLATFTGWGFLGKIDKAIRSERVGG